MVYYLSLTSVRKQLMYCVQWRVVTSMYCNCMLGCFPRPQWVVHMVGLTADVRVSEVQLYALYQYMCYEIT